jgi:hypothetical protein
MALEGIRHLIECHCVLPQYRNSNPPVFHKFIVFSAINDDQVQKKLAQCNNCGILHRIVDICKSEIVHGLEEGSSLRSIEDLKVSFPQRLSDFLVIQKLDIATWEFIEFLIDNKLEKDVVINKTEAGDITQLKILQINADGTFKIRNETRQVDVEVH